MCPSHSTTLPAGVTDLKHNLPISPPAQTWTKWMNTNTCTMLDLTTGQNGSVGHIYRHFTLNTKKKLQSRKLGRNSNNLASVGWLFLKNILYIWCVYTSESIYSLFLWSIIIFLTTPLKCDSWRPANPNHCMKTSAVSSEAVGGIHLHFKRLWLYSFVPYLFLKEYFFLHLLIWWYRESFTVIQYRWRQITFICVHFPIPLLSDCR